MLSLTHRLSRVLLSQDRHEIYVTLAEYTKNYVLYLQDEVHFKEAGFLRMQVYGPFKTNNRGHMSWLGAILRTMLPYAAEYRPSQPLSASKLRTPSRGIVPDADARVGRRDARHADDPQERGGSLPSSTSSDSEPRGRPTARVLFGENPSVDIAASKESGPQARSPFRSIPIRAAPPAATGVSQSIEQSTERRRQQENQ